MRLVKINQDDVGSLPVFGLNPVPVIGLNPGLS